MDIRQESLKKHYDWNGKIEVVSRVPISNSEELSLAYTPGVAEPCLEIQKDYNKSYELTENLYRDLCDSSEGYSTLPVNINLSQGYSHYALARIWKHLDKELDFSSLLRTRKHTSLVLTQIFTEEEWNRGDITPMNITCWSLTNYCLCRRRDVDNMPSDMEDRIKWLIDNDYLPEMKGIEGNTNPFDFLSIRKRRLEELVNEIWSIELLQTWTKSN